MSAVAPRKGLAVASLVLGLVGLLTAGGCAVGSVVGLVLGVAARVRAGRDPARYGGGDVAWAGIVTNALGVLTIGPILTLLVFLNQQGALPRPGAEEELPEPVAPWTSLGRELPPPPPPPPPPTAPGAAGPVRVGGTIREPTKLRHVNPVYPPLAVQARVQGRVILEVTISPAGKVTDLRVLRGMPLLDQAALEAVKQWEYTPTLLDGQPVPVIMTVTVTFRLN